ncbi:AIPR family protein [Maridesulfovibrio sp.]|uniref:AIPR family protein n=1 Tax=Maridesulfovibrio sp. TaxID=2795000 RepID=UPI002A18CBDA|nr:AIPR family protein [Maridesulfovibrio sp.]
MNFEPIIRAKLAKFKNQYEYENLSDPDSFELFVNYQILHQQQPDAFWGNSDTLEVVSTGGHNDLSIDGVAVIVNGIIVKSKEDIDVICGRSHKIDIDFIFIQSKLKSRYDMGEFNNFQSGVKDFLSEEHNLPSNDKIKHLLELKEYVLRDELMPQWNDSPTVKAYFVGIEKKKDLPHIAGLSRTFNSEIQNLKTYSEASIEVIDGEGLKLICDNNENNIDITIGVLESLSLTEVENVDDSNIILCYADEFINVFKNSDGSLRKTVFSDNVRDFQGETSINKEIVKTIKEEPAKFILLNNGLTVVCDDFKPRNRTIKITNPQIVNGCQTSHVLYYAHKEGFNISGVPLVVKIISTKNSGIANQILRGTNRQNIVYNEAFETTKPFHKELEAYFEAMKFNETSYYYERRSKQFQTSLNIKQHQKINFRSLIQSFTAVFLKMPNISYKHESKLIEEVGGRIFLENQSKHPYYVAAIMLLTLEHKIINERVLRGEFKAYIHHILLVMRMLIDDSDVDINNEKAIDKHCNKIIKVMESDETLMIRSMEFFRDAKNKWIAMGHSKYGIKDNKEFLNHLLGFFSAPMVNHPPENIRTEGRVAKVGFDRYGYYYGFIDYYPTDLFFHSRTSKIDSFDNLHGKTVSFKISKNAQGRDIAIDVKPV